MCAGQPQKPPLRLLSDEEAKQHVWSGKRICTLTSLYHAECHLVHISRCSVLLYLCLLASNQQPCPQFRQQHDAIICMTGYRSLARRLVRCMVLAIAGAPAEKLLSAASSAAEASAALASNGSTPHPQLIALVGAAFQPALDFRVSLIVLSFSPSMFVCILC